MTEADELRALRDREAIRQIFVDYARYLDGGDLAGYANLFARDGIFVVPPDDVVGPAAIREFLEDYLRAPDAAPLPEAVHVMNNADIAIDGDHATATVLWFYLTTDPDGVPTILQAGRYTDALVREDGAWKIARHEISRIMGRAPFDGPAWTRLDSLEQRLRRLEEASRS